MPRKDFDRMEIELHSLQNQLAQQLVRELTKVAAGQNTLFFFSSEHNPHDLPPHMLMEVTREILETARKTIELRELLGMPTDRCVGKILVAACEENAKLDNPHGLGPKRLAAQLLSQIGHEPH